MKQTTRSIVSVLITAALFGCGGGGSGGAGGGIASAVTGSAPPAVSASSSAAFDALYQPIQTAAPAAPYPSTSREAAEFKTLNEQRSICGFGLLAHNDSLKSAAVDHANFLEEYGTRINIDGLSLHEQYAKNPNGFTGATVTDRVRFRGYTGKFATEISGGSAESRISARGLGAAPYHAQDVFGSRTEVGISAMSRVLFKLSYQSKPQRKNSAVLTYPCDGVSGTEVRLQSETPSPYPPRNLAVNPIGHPVYFFADESVALPVGRKSRIDVSDLVVTEDASGMSIVMLPVQNKDTDPNALYLGSSFAYAAPDKPLKNLTKYRVRATVMANGVTTQVDYTFTTGAGER